MVLAFSAFGEIEDRAGAASMDECPAMKRCWDSAMKLQRASKVGEGFHGFSSYLCGGLRFLLNLSLAWFLSP